MLLVKVKRGQTVQIGPDVTVKLVRPHGPDAVILAIDAPPEWDIVRPGPVALDFGQALGLDGASSLLEST